MSRRTNQIECKDTARPEWRSAAVIADWECRCAERDAANAPTAASPAAAAEETRAAPCGSPGVESCAALERRIRETRQKN